MQSQVAQTEDPSECNLHGDLIKTMAINLIDVFKENIFFLLLHKRFKSSKAINNR